MQITCSHCKTEFLAEDKLLLKPGVSFQYYACPACSKPVRWKVPAASGDGAAAQPAATPPREAVPAPVPGWVQASRKTGPPQRFALAEGDNIVGRQSAANAIAVPVDPANDSVSRLHCAIEVVRDELRGHYDFLVRDLGSANGTFIKESSPPRRLAEQDVVYLSDGDALLLGETTVWLEVNPAARFVPKGRASARGDATLIMP